MKSLGVISAVCLILCLSCSVKEDRMDCPCRLVLDLSANDTASVGSAVLLVNASEDFVYSDVVEAGEFDEECVVLVPRGTVDVLAYSCDDGYVSGKEGLVIPYGEDCPEVYMHFLSVEAVQEEVRADVVLRKNYCNATICVATDDEFPYRLSLHGNVMGYGMDSSPAVGDFMYEFELDGDRTGMASLPRQMDTSLKLEVCSGAEVLKVFALGEYIAAVGYDWASDDLEDITLTLDYSLTGITISVGEWDEEYHFDISI